MTVTYVNTGTRYYGARPLYPYVRNRWEIQAVVSGQIGLRTPGRDHVPESSRLWCLGPTCSHGWWSEDRNEAAEIVVFHATDLPEELKRSVSSESFWSAPMPESLAVRLRDKVGLLKSLFESNERTARLEAVRTLYDIALLLQSFGIPGDPPLEFAESIIQRAEAIAAAELQVGISVSDIVRRVGYSESHLRRLFLTHRGVNIRERLAQLRFDRSCDLLSATSTSITEIAATVGFDSASAFCRFFRRKAGKSPEHFRALARDSR